MNRFNSETIAAMQSVLEEVCSHIPAQSTGVRVFVAVKLLECAGQGGHSYDRLLNAGRRAVTDQFANLGAVGAYSND